MSEPKKVYGPNGVLWATAPDSTWFLRGDPFPEPGVLVEACWSSRFKEPAEFEIARLRLKSTFADGSSSWLNERGLELLFGPDFWRPIP